MSTSERSAVAAAGRVKAAVWAAMAILAGAGIYGALNGASPYLTLAAGIGVGVLWVVATRERGNGR